MKTALLIGGSGFIGSNLAKALAKEYQVRIADLRPPMEIQHLENVVYIPLILGAVPNYSEMLKGVDIVFYLAGGLLPEDDTQNFEDDFVSDLFPVIQLLENMKSFEKKRLFYFSSGGTVYGDTNGLNKEDQQLKPSCKYALLKATAENLMTVYNNMHNMEAFTIRLSNPYGDRVRSNQRQGIIPILVDAIYNDKPFTVWGNGENIRDYIYINDVVNGVLSLISYNGTNRIFNIGTGQGCSINDVVSIVEKSVGRTYNKLQYGDARKCDLLSSVLDTSLITECTGWKAETTIENGVKYLLEQYDA